MTALCFSLPALALLILGAHFFRADQLAGVFVCAALLGLMALRRRWVWRVLQAALVLGALEWLWTASQFAQERMALGRPWARMALILGAVALLTLAAAALLRGARLRRWFGASDQAAAG
jgi:hypothetical protein